MRNLKKNLLLLIAIFSLMLISSFSIGKASAQQNGTCSRESTRGGIRWRCSLPNLAGTMFTTEATCNSACTTKAGENESCFKTSDCVSGLTCATADPDLGFGGTCQKPPPAPSNTCRADSDCQSGFVCVDKCFEVGPGIQDCQGVCEKKETPPAPPPAPPIPSNTCKVNNDCQSGFVCVDECFNSGPLGEVCQSVCRKKDTDQPPAARLVWRNIAQCPLSSDNCVSSNNFFCPQGKTCENIKDTGIADSDGVSLLAGKCEKDTVSAPAAAPGGQDLTTVPECFTGCGSPRTRDFFDLLITNNPLNCRADCGATADRQSACFSSACTASTVPAQPPAAPPPAAPAAPAPAAGTPPAGQSPVSLTNCAIGDGVHFCSVENPKSSFPPCSPLFGPGQTANCAANTSCWFCPLPVPTSAPTTACSPSDCGTCAVGSSCQQVAGTFTKSCTCQSSTSAPATAPIQTTTTLAVTLNAQDTVLTADTLPVALSLFNLSTNTLVQGAPATSVFNKTPIPGKQFAANIPISGPLQNKFFLLIRKDNLIARTFFTIDSSGSITVPTTTLVFGDINTDNDISILDYNILIGCFGKLATAAGCSVSDFDNGKIDAIDLNTWLRGLTTWRKQI